MWYGECSTLDMIINPKSFESCLKAGDNQRVEESAKILKSIIFFVYLEICPTTTTSSMADIALNLNLFLPKKICIYC